MQSRLQIILELVDKISKPASQAKAGVNKSLDAIKVSWKALLGTVGTVTAAISAAYKMMKRDIEIKRARTSLKAYAGSAQEAEKAIEAVREASEDTLSTFEATEVATRFLALGLAKSAAEAGELSRIALMLGASMGVDAQTSVENFSLMLANTSIPRMDLFGLSASRARKRMLELKKEFQGITREEAFKLVVIEQAQEKLENLEEAGVEVGSELERLTARWKDFRDDAIENTAEGLNDFLDMMEITDEELREQERVALYAAAAIGDIEGAARGVYRAMEDMQTISLDDYIQEILSAEGATSGLADAAGDAAGKHEELKIKMGEVTQAKIGAQAMQDLSTAYEEAAEAGDVEAMENIAEAMEQVGVGMLGIPKASIEANIALANASVVFRENTDAPKEYARQLQSIYVQYQRLKNLPPLDLDRLIPAYRGGRQESLEDQLRDLD